MRLKGLCVVRTMADIELEKRAEIGVYTCGKYLENCKLIITERSF